MQRRRGIAPEAGSRGADPAALLAAMRTDYVQSSLSETDVLADPIAQFGNGLPKPSTPRSPSRTP
jgi:pyridoxamine 5'-phosphate oxidase